MISDSPKSSHSHPDFDLVIVPPKTKRCQEGRVAGKTRQLKHDKHYTLLEQRLTSQTGTHDVTEMALEMKLVLPKKSGNRK